MTQVAELVFQTTDLELVYTDQFLELVSGIETVELVQGADIGPPGPPGPSGVGAPEWGDIGGDIEDQADLVALLASSGEKPEFVYAGPPDDCVSQGADDLSITGWVYAVVAETANDYVRQVTLRATLQVQSGTGEAGEVITVDGNAVMHALDGLAGFYFFYWSGPVALWEGTLGGAEACGTIDEGLHLRDASGTLITFAVETGDTIHYTSTAFVTND